MKPLGVQIIAEFSNCRSKILNDTKSLERILKSAVHNVGLECKRLTSYHFSPLGVTTIAIISQSHIAIHTYPECAHASIEIFTCSPRSALSNKLLRICKKALKPMRTQTIEIARGNPLGINQKDWLAPSSIGSWGVRYRIKKIVLSKRSKFQQIDIIENQDFGRMLFLDNDLQISASDVRLYNQAMMAPLFESGTPLGKVAILGGGDGGILRELLKLRPQNVVLVEIDKEVIEAAKRFLPAICGRAFSNPKVNIVISNANDFLKQKSGFDAVIYDLTMHPEIFTGQQRSTYLNKIFLAIARRLDKKGIISLQCASEFDGETLNLLKRILTKRFKKITFKKVFIPSFRERWVFASAIRK